MRDAAALLATTSCGSTARPTRTSTARITRSPSRVPAVVQRGHRVTAHVTQIDGAGHSTPIAGARVAGATTDTSGVAHLTLQQRRHDHAPGAPFRGDAVGSGVCLRLRRTSVRNVAAPGAGRRFMWPGSANMQTFTRAHAPRELNGTAGPDPSGLTDVSFSLHRRASNGHCSYYDADRAAFRSTGCGTAPPLFSVGASAKWSYLLPKALRPRHGTSSRSSPPTAPTGTRNSSPAAAGVDFTVR